MKKLFLIRGISGSGKTTFAKAVAQDGDCVVANDDFMVNAKGEYSFDGTRLDEAGQRCEDTVREAMRRGTKRIFVHNTFTTSDEMERYFKLANEFSYDIQTLIVENRGGWKSEHGVPDTTLQKQRERFDIKL